MGDGDAGEEMGDGDEYGEFLNLNGGVKPALFELKNVRLCRLFFW